MLFINVKHVLMYAENGKQKTIIPTKGGPLVGGPGFNPHHIKLSGLDVSPFKVSGGSPVHLRSKHRATGSRTWMEDHLGQKQIIQMLLLLMIIQ